MGFLRSPNTNTMPKRVYDVPDTRGTGSGVSMSSPEISRKFVIKFAIVFEVETCNSGVHGITENFIFSFHHKRKFIFQF